MSNNNQTNLQIEQTIPVEIGLDASTTTVGIAVLNEQTGELIELSYFDLSSSTTDYADIYEKIAAIREHLQKKLCINNWALKDIHVEEYVKQFTPGFSSADTLFTLAIFNHSVCQFFYDKYQIKPNKINVRSVRKSLGINVDYKDKTKSTKEKVFDIVRTRNPNFPWLTTVVKSGKNKGNTVYIKQNNDMADAWVVAFGGWTSKQHSRIFQYQISNNIIEVVTKKNKKTGKEENYIYKKKQ